MKLVYGDGTDGVIGDELIEPLPVGTEPFTKTFTVYNDGNVNTDYGVYLIDVINTFERKDDIKYTMSCETDGTLLCGSATSTTFPSGISELVTATIEPKKTHTYTFSFTYYDTGTDQSVDMNKTLQAKIQIFGKNNNGLIIPYETNTLAYNIVNNASNSINVTTLDLVGSTEAKVANYASTSIYGKTNPTSYPSVKTDVTTSNTYTYASDYTIDSNGKFTLVNVQTLKYSEGYETLKGKYIVSTIGSSSTTAETSTSISTIYKVSPTEVTSTSFNYISVNKYVSTEKVIATTEDDYGTSYYYRGGVENNYVNFAGMCWRVVRIDGNGNTKLILEDQYTTCDNENYTGAWNIEASDRTNITLNGPNAYRTGNFGYDDLTGKYKMLYLNPVDNPNRAMVNAFKYFQTETLSSKITSTYTGKTISDYLVSGNWCLNNKAYSDTTGTTLLENPTYTSAFYYDSSIRLAHTTKEPTLKCPVAPLYKFDDNQDGVVSDIETDMYVGTLTADEITYAGGKYGFNNYAYYLLNDYQREKSMYFWSLSPSYFNNYDDVAFVVLNDGVLGHIYVYNDIAFRPAVSLASSAVISSGEGTLEKPYVIG